MFSLKEKEKKEKGVINLRHTALKKVYIWSKITFYLYFREFLNINKNIIIFRKRGRGREEQQDNSKKESVLFETFFFFNDEWDFLACQLSFVQSGEKYFLPFHGRVYYRSRGI